MEGRDGELFISINQEVCLIHNHQERLSFRSAHIMQSEVLVLHEKVWSYRIICRYVEALRHLYYPHQIYAAVARLSSPRRLVSKYVPGVPGDLLAGRPAAYSI
jgi:hypothetical protein